VGDSDYGDRDQHRLDFEPGGRPTFALPLELKVNGMQSLIAVDGRTEWASPSDVRGQVSVRDVSNVLIPTDLQFCYYASHGTLRFHCNSQHMSE
jgi:hypothetical protein